MAEKKRTANPQPLALWQLGMLCIIAGPIANLVLGMIWPLEPPFTAAEQGQALGRGAAAMLAVVAGVVLIVVHLVRRYRR